MQNSKIQMPIFQISVQEIEQFFQKSERLYHLIDSNFAKKISNH